GLTPQEAKRVYNNGFKEQMRNITRPVKDHTEKIVVGIEEIEEVNYLEHDLTQIDHLVACLEGIRKELNLPNLNAIKVDSSIYDQSKVPAKYAYNKVIKDFKEPQKIIAFRDTFKKEVGADLPNDYDNNEKISFKKQAEKLLGKIKRKEIRYSEADFDTRFTEYILVPDTANEFNYDSTYTCAYTTLIGYEKANAEEYDKLEINKVSDIISKINNANQLSDLLFIKIRSYIENKVPAKFNYTWIKDKFEKKEAQLAQKAVDQATRTAAISQ
ncbi:11325_t:CDS:2, partial [Funneliformis geosporum]